MTGNGPSPSGTRRSSSSGLPFGRAYSIASNVENVPARAAAATRSRRRNGFTPGLTGRLRLVIPSVARDLGGGGRRAARPSRSLAALGMAELLRRAVPRQRSEIGEHPLRRDALASVPLRLSGFLTTTSILTAACSLAGPSGVNALMVVASTTVTFIAARAPIVTVAPP